jgi:CUB domain
MVCLQFIGLKFSRFSTENAYDFVNLYNGASTSSPLITRLTGAISLAPAYVSNQRYMLITFTSDGSYEYYGFVANFTSGTGMSSVVFNRVC